MVWILGITKRQFDHVLSRALPIAVYIAMSSLGITVARAVTDSIFSNKNAVKNVPATIVTLIFSAIISVTFALSVVCIIFFNLLYQRKDDILNNFYCKFLDSILAASPSSQHHRSNRTEKRLQQNFASASG